MLFPIFYGFIAPDIASIRQFSAVDTAIDLAVKLDAQLSVAIGALQISVPNVLGSGTVQGLISNENKRSIDSAATAREQIVDAARSSGLTVHTEILTGNLDQIKSRCANRARVHGMVFAEAGLSGELLGGVLIEALLFEGGRPLFVVPNGYSSEIKMDRIMIAWDGSPSAARAVWDSIPVLRLAKTIEIVTVVGEKHLNDVPAADTLAPMLSYLGKTVEVTALPYAAKTTAGLIKQHAKNVGAGLVVQGAYGRSRWSELILGGVTREMLRDCTMPVLMSH
jgi:nucleotide-binding universal stress UspA family protein